MSDSFKISINAEEIAEKFGEESEKIMKRLKQDMESLSIDTHSFVVTKANTELSHNDYLRNAFLGTGEVKHDKKSDNNSRIMSPDAKNIRWNKVAENLWVVELDESVEYIDKGRPRTSMATSEWLLKPSKSKMAVDGSLYRSIPMPAGKPSMHTQESTMGTPMFLKEALNKAARSQKINLRKMEYDQSGNPKFGILHKLDVSKFEQPALSKPGAFSKPRTPEEAAATGLKAHEGHFMIGGAAVIQRPANNKAGAVRETVVFRTVSSKHQNEDRWMYPEIKGINAIESAYEWANQKWDEIVKSIEEEFGRMS